MKKVKSFLSFTTSEAGEVVKTVRGMRTAKREIRFKSGSKIGALAITLDPDRKNSLENYIDSYGPKIGIISWLYYENLDDLQIEIS